MSRAVFALCLSGCASVSVPGATVERRTQPADDDLLEVVPADAEVVLTLDMAQLRSSRWTREIVTARPQGPADRGFDEVNDVDKLVIARLASTGEETSLSIAQGRFDPARLEASFRRTRPAAALSRQRGIAVWTEGSEALAFLTRRTVLSGPTAAVRGAIEASLALAPAAGAQAWIMELQDALEKRGGGRTRPALTAAVLVTDAVRARLQQEFAEAEGLERLGARLDLDETLHIDAVGATRGRADAAALASRIGSMLHGLRTRASLAVLGLLPVLDRTRVSTQGTRVVGELHLREQERDAIVGRLAMAAKIIAGRRRDE